MITEIRYKNFKALRDATLPLGRFTLIVGANGTGKTTAIKAMKLTKNIRRFLYLDVVSAGLSENYDIEDEEKNVAIEILWGQHKTTLFWEYLPFDSAQLGKQLWYQDDGSQLQNVSQEFFSLLLNSFRIFSFDSDKIAQSVSVRPNIQLDEDGGNLAGVLMHIQNSNYKVFEKLNTELQMWFPEFERVTFDIPEENKISFLLQTKHGQNKIKAEDLSDGTRLALAYLTLAYLPNPPKIVAFEEPERGIHPRLLRNIQEAMDRLAYPENYGEKREPVQVIATTHSPYLLDLYKDRREEIVIADKDENGVHFERLVDLPNIEKILQEQDAPLGDVWFSGVLGGVPAQL
jgi:predicted ATPase